MLGLVTKLRMGNVFRNMGLFFIGWASNRFRGASVDFILLMISMTCFNIFILTVNDYYDAPFDKIVEEKRSRNPFCGENQTERRVGLSLMYSSVVLSLLLSAAVSIYFFFLSCVANLVAFLYSSPLSRAKGRFFWDWLTGVIWKVAVLLSGYIYFFEPGIDLYPWLAIAAVFGVLSQIENQLRDIEVDEQTNHRTTVTVIGEAATRTVRSIFRAAMVMALLTLTLVSEAYASSASVIVTTLAWYAFYKDKEIFLTSTACISIFLSETAVFPGNGGLAIFWLLLFSVVTIIISTKNWTLGSLKAS